jgi:hypothetical protein
MFRRTLDQSYNRYVLFYLPSRAKSLVTLIILEKLPKPKLRMCSKKVQVFLLVISKKEREVRSTLDSFVALLHKTTVTDHCGISEGGLTGLYLGGVIELNVEPIQFR